HPGRAAGRQERDRAGGGRPVPLHPFVPQVQLLRRSGEQEEPVVGQGGHVEFEGGRRTAARRLQADPPEPVARRRGLVWEEPEPVERPERVARLWFRLSDHLTPLLSPGVLTDPSSIVPTRGHPNGRRLRASRGPSRGGNKRAQTRSSPVTS